MTREGISLRRATPADARTLAEMRARSRAERHGDESEALARFVDACEIWFARELAARHRWIRAWLALDGERVIGTATLTLVPTLPRMEGRRPIDGRVRNVYVDPLYRTLGFVAKADEMLYGG